MKYFLHFLHFLFLCAAVSLSGLGCGEGADATVASAKEVFVLPQSASIAGRDGGLSGLCFGHSVWAFGDTVLTLEDEQGSTWHHNSFSFTDDLIARDGISGFGEPTDSKGAPRYLIAPTEDEAQFNQAHQGDPCQEMPCGARFAAWPGNPVFDGQNNRAFIPYGLIYAEPGDFNFKGVGQSIAIWNSFDSMPERPVIHPDWEHPTLLFKEGEPSYGLGAVISEGQLYSFDCPLDGFSRPCTLARVALDKALDRSAWQFWNGSTWTSDMHDTEVVFDGAPIMTVSYNAYLQRWTVIYSDNLSNDVCIRTAEALTGPWSDELVLFVADRKQGDGTVYDASPHPEMAEDNGRVLYISHSRPTGTGWFDAELAVWRVELE